MEKSDTQTKPSCYCTATAAKATLDNKSEDKPAFTETNPLNATTSKPWSAFKDLYWI